MKYNYKLLAIVFFIIIIMFPIKVQYKDGGTMEYRAIVYKIIKWHRFNDNYESGIKEGTEIHIFPTNYHSLDYYDDVMPNKFKLFYPDYLIPSLIGVTGSYEWCNNYGRCENVEKLMDDNIDSYPTLKVQRNIALVTDKNYIIKDINVYKNSFNNEVDKQEFGDYFIMSPNENGKYLYKVTSYDNKNKVEYYFVLDVN